MPLATSQPASGLRIASLQFAYEGQMPVIAIDSLEIEAGAQVFLEGPSGGGKTTLLGLLAGVLVAQRGEIEVAGTRLSSLSPAARDRFRGESVGYLFQHFNLLPYLDLIDNVALPCHLHPARGARLGGQKPEDAARHWLEAFDLGDFAQRKPAQLSVGQQQRAALARALIGRPRLILADEPGSALDQERRSLFLEQLLRTCRDQQITLLVVSHDTAAGDLFDRRLNLRELNLAFSERPT